MKRQVAHIQPLEFTPPADEEQVEVTLVNPDELPHLWPRERLNIFSQRKNVGKSIVKQLVAVRYGAPEREESNLVTLNFYDNGIIDLEENPELEA